MLHKVRAVNLHKSYKLNERFAQTLAVDVLKLVDKGRAADLELIFMDDKSIKAFNKRYRSRNRTTDVLSFRIDRNDFCQKAFLGVIMISLDTAHRNAKSYDTTLPDEIALYIIHGILHLFGYDDENPQDSRTMNEKQNRILDKLCISRHLSRVLTPR